MRVLKSFSEEFPNLRTVPVTFRAGALKFWNEGDISNILAFIESHQYFEFIEDNLVPLYSCGFLEELLVTAITGFNTMMAPFPHRLYLKSLLNFAKIEKLRSYGDPFPHDESFELYRGVVDGGNIDLIRGLSWTGSPEIASWFATKFNPSRKRKNPAIFKLIVPNNKIYFYSNDRNEDEFVVDVWPQARPKRLPELPPPQRMPSVAEQKLSLKKFIAKNS